MQGHSMVRDWLTHCEALRSAFWFEVSYNVVLEEDNFNVVSGVWLKLHANTWICWKSWACALSASVD